MARRDYGSEGLEQENNRLVESLQYSNKLLFGSDEELKKAIRIKSEFMAKISHESRSQLNVIIGFTQLMLDEVPGKINEEQRHSLNDILTAGKRLLDLINNLIDQSEVESGGTQ